MNVVTIMNYSVPAFKHLSAEVLSEIADALEEVYDSI